VGDVKTHASIAAAVRALLPAGEAALFFEVGNYLTDVSQFRDPYAHIGGKKRMWQIGKSENRALFFFGLLDLAASYDEYLDDLMGLPGEGPRVGTEGDPATWRPDDGQLAQWFRDVILVSSSAKFKRDGIDKHQFLAVYERRFTQYYPHEHVDFPPWPHGSALGEERARPSQVDVATGGAKRKVLRYLDDQLEYIADLLSKVEKEWARVAPTPENAPARRELLALMGHASHAVEDYFFHSSFAELAWAQSHPTDPAPTRPVDPPTAEELESFGPPTSDTKRQRIYHRRRRAPLAEADDSALSKESSDATTLMYTGSFGGNDIFFTLVDAIGHMLMEEPRPDEPPEARAYRDGIRRVVFGTPDEQAAALATHNARLRSGYYVRKAREAQAMGALEVFEVEAIQRACARDLDLATRYTLIASKGTPLGIVGMLQKLMGAAREAARLSAERSVAIDTDQAHRIEDDRSDNLAPAENIGSHSLMAKDSIRKEPLRVETVNLATLTATYLARRMVERMPATTPTADGGLDWADAVRHFVGHPSQAASDATGPWWAPAMASIDPRPAELHDVRTLDATAFDARAAEPHRRPLEQRYEELSVVVQREYRSAVNGDFVLDSALTGAVLGAILGTISGFANAPAGSAGRTVGAGALGLIVGGAIGLGVSALLTGIGTAASDSAGSVVGATVGWIADPVLAWLLMAFIAPEL
jgi:hypothetical protein